MFAKGFPTADLSAAGDIPADPSPESSPPLKCPRCDSSHTKFCYYNNYSLRQPRHFCKACKRYWTLGGALRNVPVGGGCRKNKRRPKPQSRTTTLPKASVRPPIPAVDFRSLIHDTALFFPGSDLDSQIAGFYFRSGIAPDLEDFRGSSEGRVVDPAMGISGGWDLGESINRNLAGVCYDWEKIADIVP